MKFSIIVPVYNVEKYLRKCLDSIINQTYKDFEVIVVNDGSPDNSQSIIDEYVNNYPEKMKSYIKPNGGLSDARNYGMNYVTGDYVVFIDSDDYIKEDMLEVINSNIADNEDVVGYGLITVDENYNVLDSNVKVWFDTTDGENAILKLINSRFAFETACTYAYNVEYWKKNNYKFEVGKYHEDFGLTPIVIAKANRVKYLNYLGYYYLQNSNSITKNPAIAVKKAYDVLFYYDRLIRFADTMKNASASKYLKSYVANAVLTKKGELDGEEKKKYIKEIQKRDVCGNLLGDTFKRKVKKFVCRIKLIFD